ncbi:hypothetical protein [Deinococcus humi]|uniref:Uncharacterized protein n=1 Tax=Deinococcus humi TaxID=662880 RepID=A0A7W8NFY5_9DEIO|nr:hypothetical protein [Deinococcus humi]MBB5362417.1 hypothetical protein [Deinococcus humi]
MNSSPGLGERWAELVELYEYRVADTLQGRVPRSGRRALANLREELLSAPLESALYRRLLEADRQFRAYQKTLSRPQAASPLPPQQALWDVTPNSESEEAQAWHELHVLAWGDAARAALKSHLADWRREPELLSLRVLYAALENAERAGQAGLAGQITFAVPKLNDPLTALDNPQVLQVLMEAAVELLLQPGGSARLETALTQIQETPFPRHPDEDVLRAWVAAAEREQLAPQAKDTLIQALQTQFEPSSRDPRERPAIRQAARDLTEGLGPLLASDPQPTLVGVPNHSVLYAVQPNIALRAPDDGAADLVIYLPGAQGVRWRETDFHWQAIGHNWQLLAGNQVALLQPQADPLERGVTLKLPHTQFRAFVSGAYLLLRAQTSPHDELVRLVSLGRAVSLLLDPAESYAALRLGRAAAQLLRDGRVDSGSLTASSAAKYALASPTALMCFARKGAEALCAHLAPHNAQAILDTLRAAARPLGLTGTWDDRLAGAIDVAAHRWEDLPPPLKQSRVHLPVDGSGVCVELRDDPPLSLQFGARAITLRRDFRREWAVIMPGHAPMPLHDLTVARVPGFNVILARHGDWLAAAAQPTQEAEVNVG